MRVCCYAELLMAASVKRGSLLDARKNSLVLPLRPRSTRDEAKMKGLIAAALIVCVTIGVVAWAIIRHVNNTQAALWCHEHGYTNYVTKDGFCVGARGKLIKVGL